MASAKLKFLYFGIRVRDLERSLRFYKSLGFRVRNRGTMAHGGEWLQMTMPRSTVRLELNYYPKGNRFYEPFGPGYQLDHLGFYSAAPDRALDRMVRAGGKVAIPAWDEPHSRIGYVNDPDGVALEVFGPLPKPRRRPASRRRRGAA
jgi:catechol 2,3-dioxygenase-like lactoylglutathione lyase family enzyme